MKTTNASFAIFLSLLYVLLYWSVGEVKAQPKEIIEAAKKEGQLVFYSGIPVPDGKLILSEFVAVKGGQA